MAQTPKPHSEQPLTWHDDEQQRSPATVTQTNVTQTDASQHSDQHSHSDAALPAAAAAAAAAAAQQANSAQALQSEPLPKWRLHSATPSVASSVLSDSLTGPLLDHIVAKASAQAVDASS
jgi:hypothetical protein